MHNLQCLIIFGEWKGNFSLKLHHEKKKKMKRQVKPMKIMQFTLVINSWCFGTMLHNRSSR